MQKRKLPDFLSDPIALSKKKQQKWLKNYPILRLSLDHLIKQFKQVELQYENILSTSNVLVAQIFDYNLKFGEIFDFCGIAIHYLKNTIAKNLFEIKNKIEFKNEALTKIYNNISHNRSNNETFDSYTNALRCELDEIEQYISKINQIYFKKLEFLIFEELKKNVPQMLVILKNLHYITHVKDEEDLNLSKQILKFDYYHEYPKMLIHEQIPDQNFCKFLSNKISDTKEYQEEVRKNMDLFIKYNRKKKFKIENQIFYLDENELHLVKPLRYKYNKTQLKIYNYLFIDESHFIELQPIVNYDDWLKILPFDINCIVNEYYTDIKKNPIQEITNI